MRHQPIAAILLSLSLAPSGCATDENTPPPTPTAAPLAVDAYAAAYGRELCRKTFACCSPGDVQWLFDIPFLGPPAPVVDEASCEAAMNGPLGAQLIVAATNASVTAGYASWDAQRAGACVARLEAMSCADFSARHGAFWGNVDVDCDPPIVAKAPLGSACITLFDCVGGVCADGKCVAPPKQGEPCAGQECGAGLYCEAGVCATRRPDGAACRRNEQCAAGGCNAASPFVDGVCGAPLVCDGDAANNETVFGDCYSGDNSSGRELAVACRLLAVGYTEKQWQCICTKDGTSVGACTAPDDGGGNACLAGSGLGCCTF